MPQAQAHDGAVIEIEIHGEGPDLLLPVNPEPVEGSKAEEIRRYGADPALGRKLIEGLREDFRVISFDYEGHVFANPKPETLTPENIAGDMLAVASAAQAERFAYYGYSWLGLAGLQLAIRTQRITALVVGGWPPLNAPYEQMLKVTQASVDMSMAQTSGPAQNSGEWDSTSLSVEQSLQFHTLYRALEGFDDRAALDQVACPALSLVGTADEVDYPEQWGGVLLSIGPVVAATRDELESLEWDVHLFEGLDHMQAMQAEAVLPVLRDWFAAKLLIAAPSNT